MSSHQHPRPQRQSEQAFHGESRLTALPLLFALSIWGVLFLGPTQTAALLLLTMVTALGLWIRAGRPRLDPPSGWTLAVFAAIGVLLISAAASTALSPLTGASGFARIAKLAAIAIVLLALLTAPTVGALARAPNAFAIAMFASGVSVLTSFLLLAAVIHLGAISLEERFEMLRALDVNLNRAGLAASVAVWIAAVAATSPKLRTASIAAACLFPVVALLYDLSAVVVSGMAAVAAYAAVRLIGSRIVVPLFATAGAALAAAPLYFASTFFTNAMLAPIWTGQNSFLHRALIWRYVAERLSERPWFGWGIDASKSLPGGDRPMIENQGFLPEAWLDAAHFAPILSSESLPLHPHSLPLQLYLETGVVGVAIVVGLLLLIGRAIAGQPVERAAPLTAAAFAALVIASISIGAWQSWWLSLLALCTWVAANSTTGAAPAHDRTNRWGRG